MLTVLTQLQIVSISFDRLTAVYRSGYVMLLAVGPIHFLWLAYQSFVLPSRGLSIQSSSFFLLD